MSTIRLMIPNASPLHNLDKVKIIGLSTITKEEVDLERIQFSLSLPGVEVHPVPIAISPYHFTNDWIAKTCWDELKFAYNADAMQQAIRSIFSSEEIYGQDIMWKVKLYEQLAFAIAEKICFDVVHAHDWVTYPAAGKIARHFSKPLILHVHALETDRAGMGVRNEIYEIERNNMLNADRVVAVSEYTKQQIVQHYFIEPTKISVVYNGIDHAPARRSAKKIKDKIVVFLGRITGQKGPQYLLETASKVVSVYPRVKFVVAGTGDQFTHLLESSAYQKLGRQFIFTGFLTKVKVSELLSLADVYFMPSVSEPFGLTALEAAQQKVPTVISSQSGVAEVMRASLKSDFWDTNKHANYIHALLRYNALGKEIAEAAHQELDGLTWNHAAARIIDIYKELLV